MAARRTLCVVGVLVVFLTSAQPARAGEWITPGWWPSKQPEHAPVPLFWFVVRTCPLVYRTEVSLPPGVGRATDRAIALLRTSGYAYVCVDGRQVFAFAPRRADRRRNIAAVPADPTSQPSAPRSPSSTRRRSASTLR